MGKTKKPALRPYAQYALASIRLFNGATALVAPTVLIQRLEGTSPPPPAAVYAFRLFGIRTVLLGLHMFTDDGDKLREGLREGLLIHGSDTMTAALLGIRGMVPPRTAALITAISATNVALCLQAWKQSK
ncbi:hypothetical protein [Streptomyces ochraceiscleroticus]|uniref:DUF4267 domain-containing protein n=1 Tax=Streptomyces ochraceiscleroticus TaxID=47761 RepID=A0ABW1MQC2_9ACTN|nr:hypothetical protein [Streptomyces ochraceiscleroticus]